MRMTLFTVACLGMAPAMQAADSAAPFYEEQALFQSGRDGYHTYRIPSLVVTRQGTVLALAEARRNSSSDHGNLDLALRRSEDGGRTWSRMQIIVDDGEHTIGNPCPVVDGNTGTIWLPYCRNNKEIFLIHSIDDGQTWSKPVDITAAGKDPAWHWVGTGPGHGIQLRSGRLVIPCWADATPTLGEVQFSYCFFSDDAGRTWQCGSPLDRDGSDECEVVELSDGSLYMAARSRQEKKHRAYAFSRDGGETWSPVKYDFRLPEPSCQGSVIRLKPETPGGKAGILLAHASSPTARTHMTVYLSTDECQNWDVRKLVRAGSSAYCDLAITNDGAILLMSETDEYKRLTLARFNVAWLKAP